MSGYEEFITDGEENATTPWPSDAAHRGVARHECGPDCRRLSTSQTDVQLVVESAASCRSTIRPRIRRWHRVRLATASSRKRYGSTIASSRSARAPPAATVARDATVVLCNTGSVNHVGPGRLYVTARALLGEPRLHRRARRPRPCRRQHPRRSRDREPSVRGGSARRAARSCHLGSTLDRQRPCRRRRLVLRRVPGAALWR